MTDLFELVGRVSLEGGDDVKDQIDNMNSGFTTLKATIANLISQGITKLGQAITENIGGAISRVDTIAAFNRTMQMLGYSSEDVSVAIDQLKDGILGLPTTLPTILTSQQQFSALLGNLDQATQLTLALNNATLAGGQGQEIANSALTQWYQMIANGTPDMQSWRIINSAMPAQLNMIAEACLGAGAKAKDLFSQWQGGVVTTDDVINALISLNNEGSGSLSSFSEQALGSSSGIKTSMTNTKTAIVTALAEVITAINGDEGRISGFFDNIKQIIKDIQPIVVDFATSAIEKFEEFTDWCGENQGAIELVAEAIGVLVTAWAGFELGTKLQTMVQGFQQAQVAISLYQLSTNGASISQGLLNGTLTVSEGLVALLTGKITLAEFASAMWAKTQALLNGVLSANPIGLVVAGITALIAIGVILYNKCEGFRNFINGLWEGIKGIITSAKEKIEELNTKIGQTFTDIKDTIKEKIETAKDTVKEVIDKIKSFFDFKWELPKLKMPHVKIEGEFSLLPPKVPKFSIDWYKEGGILKQPTIFGFNPFKNSPMVGGEAGAEAIAPISELQGYVRSAVREQNMTIEEVLYSILELLSDYLPQLQSRKLVLDSGAVVGELSSPIDYELGVIKRRKDRQ